MNRKGFLYRVYDLYADGFRSMTLGRTLWAIILIKLFVIFVILKLFFFPNFIKEHAAEGSQSLFVSGRTDNWNGATVMLDSAVYQPGECYHFKAQVMQESGAEVQMKMTLQYNMDGEKYDQIALAQAPSGEWITLENLAYMIPEGAENLQLYVESPDSLTDFYVDAVSGAERAD